MMTAPLRPKTAQNPRNASSRPAAAQDNPETTLTRPRHGAAGTRVGKSGTLFRKCLPLTGPASR